MAAPQKVYAGEDFFVYEADFLAVAAATSAPQQTITIQADSDFELLKLSQVSDIAGAVETEATAVLPLATLLIQVGSSGRNLMINPVPIPNLFGSGRIPMVLPRGRIFQAQTTITLTYTNYSAATTYNTRLSFIGRKLYLK
jgi:hypothetical protein